MLRAVQDMFCERRQAQCPMLVDLQANGQNRACSSLGTRREMVSELRLRPISSIRPCGSRAASLDKAHDLLRKHRAHAAGNPRYLARTPMNASLED